MDCFAPLSNQKLKYLPLGILWLVGVIILYLAYVQPFQGDISYAQFWFGIMLCMIPAIFLLLDNYVSSIGKVITLLIWGSTLYLPKVLRSPSFFNFQDEALHFQFLTLLHQTGNLSVTSTILNKLPILLHYPSLELVTNSFASVTGQSLFSAALVLIGIFHVLQPVFVFLMVKNIFSSNRIAAIGAFVFTCNPSYIFFDSLFSYESLGILLFVFLVFLLSKTYTATSNKRLFLCLSLVTLFGLVFTHPFSSYMFIIFAGFLAFVQLIRTRKGGFDKEKLAGAPFVYFALLAVIFVIAYIVCSAPTTITDFMQLSIQRINSVVNFFAPNGQGQRALFSKSLLPRYEVIIDYLYFPIVLLLSTIAVYHVRKDRLRSTFVYSLVIYGPLILLLSLPLILTGAAEITYRVLPFLFVGVAPIIAYGANKTFQNKKFHLKIFVFVALILIAIGGISFRGDESGRFLGASNFASGPSAVTSDLISASNWFEQNAGRYNIMMGDAASSTVFGGLGVQNVVTYGAWNVFFPDTINGTVIGTLISSNVTYVIVDKRLTEYTSQNGYYFDAAQLTLPNPLGYGLNQTLPVDCITKFNNNSLFTRIYSNDNITIYLFDLKTAKSLYIGFQG